MQSFEFVIKSSMNLGTRHDTHTSKLRKQMDTKNKAVVNRRKGNKYSQMTTVFGEEEGKKFVERAE